MGGRTYPARGREEAARADEGDGEEVQRLDERAVAHHRGLRVGQGGRVRVIVSFKGGA